MSRDFHLPGRSQVIACEGMAATSHPLATLAGIETLRAGGNAADAAVTAVAVQCVVEPHMTGIGGDCFCLIAEPDKPVWGYNGCGRAGAEASTEALLKQGIRSIAPDSPHAVTVPGSIEAWGEILKTHGRFSLDRVLAPAIRYAEGGFPIAPRVASDWSKAVPKLAAHPGAKRHYLPGGKAPAEGDVMKLPALAATLKAIAKDGPRAFYEGPIAQDMVKTVAELGSVLTVDDFARHRGEVQTPISTNYRGLDLVELPPNGQGLTALVLLNILEQFDMAALDPLGPDRFHLMLEARAHGLRGARHPHRRSLVHARRRAARCSTRRSPRHSPPASTASCAFPCRPRRRRQRHRLSHRGRPRPHGGVVHQLALFGVRRRHLHRADRRHAQQSRRLLRARSRASQRVRTQQAADAHDYPRLAMRTNAATCRSA
jgi:gamma-glutamyltranspeptidase/glutathione hydrolase